MSHAHKTAMCDKVKCSGDYEFSYQTDTDLDISAATCSRMTKALVDSMDNINVNPWSLFPQDDQQMVSTADFTIKTHKDAGEVVPRALHVSPANAFLAL